MTDDEIRSLVRVAIQKHLGAPANVESGYSRIAPPAAVVQPQPPVLSISFSRYALPRAGDDTMCMIEPAVKCNHCGYCQCHGH
jgi:hypothetical protein